MEYTTKGLVVNMSQQLLKGVQVSDGINVVFTNSQGKFNIRGEWNESTPLTLSFNLEGYTNKIVTITTLTQLVKNDVGVIELKSLVDNKIQQQIKLEKANVDLLKSKLTPTADILAVSRINNLSNTITRTSLPVVLDLLSRFGINNPLGNNQPTPNTFCPPLSVLNIIVEKRNKIAKQINNVYSTTNTTLKTVEGIETILTIFEALFSTLKILPIPTLPPGTPSLVPLIQDTKNLLLSPNISKFKGLTNGLTLSLSTLVERLQQLLDLLNLLDTQLQKCAEGSEVNLTSINETLLSLNSQQPPQPQNIVVNGFTFDTETENTTDNLKRNRAIAKNAQGVILLRGEYSFSSQNQILINELIFYIQTNNLKAD